MFNIVLDYPKYEEELQVVKQTTSDESTDMSEVMSANVILEYQNLIRKIPIADNVMEYAVGLATKSRPDSDMAPEMVQNYLSWGAGPRASQFLVMGAKCHAALSGKYSPDIDDVRAVALPIMRHRILKNYKAEADGISVEHIIHQLF
jgi:MoxR-like ATPase